MVPRYARLSDVTVEVYLVELPTVILRCATRPGTYITDREKVIRSYGKEANVAALSS